MVKLFASTLRARDEDEEEDEPTKETAQARPLFFGGKNHVFGIKNMVWTEILPKTCDFPHEKMLTLVDL